MALSKFKIENVDATIHLEKPRLGPYKEKIRKHLARLLHISKECVNIKAKTREGEGAVGRGEAVACDVTLLGRKLS